MRAQVYRLPEPEERGGQYRVVGPLAGAARATSTWPSVGGCFYVFKFYRYRAEDRVAVKMELENPGTYTRTLWDADQKRTVTLGNVTFP